MNINYQLSIIYKNNNDNKSYKNCGDSNTLNSFC